MPDYSLLFARDVQDADDSAVIDWRWYRGDELHREFVRPDNSERVRFAYDMPGVLTGLRWHTKVYLGRNWKQRQDASQIMGYLDSGMFKEADPLLPPPRLRKPREDKATLGRLIARYLEQRE